LAKLSFTYQYGIRRRERYVRCNNFLPNSYINLLPLDEQLHPTPLFLSNPQIPQFKIFSPPFFFHLLLVAFGLFAKSGRRWRRRRIRKEKR
jgi:hypothetical protein